MGLIFEDKFNAAAFEQQLAQQGIVADNNYLLGQRNSDFGRTALFLVWVFGWLMKRANDFHFIVFDSKGIYTCPLHDALHADKHDITFTFYPADTITDFKFGQTPRLVSKDVSFRTNGKKYSFNISTTFPGIYTFVPKNYKHLESKHFYQQ